MQDKNIPLLDCPTDYLVGDASGKIMNEYGRFPCKIQCGVYAFMVRGTASATINITQRVLKANDFLLIEPGSFLLIHEFSEDALVYYVLFSSSFLEKNTFSQRVPFEVLNESNLLISLAEEQAEVVKGMIEVLLKALNCTPSMLSSARMVHIYNLLQTSFIEYAKAHANYVDKPQDRKSEIYQEYSRLVLKHYTEWHHVSSYADEMRITLPHLCYTIKQASNRTAGDLIVDAILTDAKAQLKITNHQIKEIALSLGFENVAFFNRFFKAHTGVTPKVYRNS